MQKIRVTADSTVDMTAEQLEKYGIITCPLGVEVGGELFKDDGNVDIEKIYSYYEETGKICHSSACNVADYEEIFGNLLKDCDAIIHISLSSELSSTYHNACLAAEELENVYVIDSRELSTGIALLAIKATELAAKGEMNAEEIVKEIQNTIPRVDVSFVLDTLDYIHAGGRCSSVAKLGANLLKLKPKIEMRNGAMSVGKKFRGKDLQVRLDYARDTLYDPEDIEDDRIFITYSGRIDDDQLQKIKEEVLKIVPFREVLFSRAGVVISAHCGPACYGLLFIRKTPVKK